ncbi:MAG: hypothetical protein SGPRY_008942, partial [Prymnesium sp.]
MGSSPLRSLQLRDHRGEGLGSAALSAACMRALHRQKFIQMNSRSLPLSSFPDASPTLPAKCEGGLCIAFLIMGHRPFAHATIARLIRPLFSPRHLFILHLDQRTPEHVSSFLHQEYASLANVVWLPSRAVGWGGFSMVEVLLAAILTALSAAHGFDFFINLSDADLPLRTERELSAFLAPRRGRSFVGVKFPEVDRMRYQAHAHMRRVAWVECEGRGFAVVNSTPASFFGEEARRCCY